VENPAQSLLAHRVIFTCQATTPLALPPFPGPAVRGALLDALRLQICAPLHGAGRRGGQDMVQDCPVCAFIAPVDDQAQRGRDIVRLFTVEPPLDVGGAHPSGWSFSFGLTLFGPAVTLYPHLTVATQNMGLIGFGQRGQAAGRFNVLECWADDPFSGRRERIMEAHSATLAEPSLPISSEIICRRASVLAGRYGGSAGQQQLTVRFLTPTRLIADKRLTKSPAFDVLVRRLVRRLSDLAEATSTEAPSLDVPRLLLLSEAIQIADDRTRWMDLMSHSGRTGRSTPIGGLVGDVTYQGDLLPFLPLLLWSEVTHVGKDTTKGNGLCRILPA